MNTNDIPRYYIGLLIHNYAGDAVLLQNMMRSDKTMQSPYVFSNGEGLLAFPRKPTHLSPIPISIVVDGLYQTNPKFADHVANHASLITRIASLDDSCSQWYCLRARLADLHDIVSSSFDESLNLVSLRVANRDEIIAQCNANTQAPSQFSQNFCRYLQNAR
jgi:hypothetical protein